MPPCQPENAVGKLGGEQQTERLHQERLSMMDEERKGLEAKVAQLEESLELMQVADFPAVSFHICHYGFVMEQLTNTNTKS